MRVEIIDTISQYDKMLSLPLYKQDNYFRYEMMKPFHKMWQTINVPIRAKKDGGYDLLMAAKMVGMSSTKNCESQINKLNILKSNNVNQLSRRVINDCLSLFEPYKVQYPNLSEMVFGIYLADENSSQIKINKGYTGFGGIPGYFMVLLNPNDYTLERLPLAIAHEINHQFRLSYEPWKMNITLGEYMVLEGLAESFAVSLYGEELIGPWVGSIDIATLNELKEIVYDDLSLTGFAEVGSYMFGDELAILQGFQPAGVPYGTGYAIGYHLTQYYLNKSHKNIIEATFTSTDEILKECLDFWQVKS